MNTQEFSDNFDTLTNVFKVNYGFGQDDKVAFDEYEKSVFLTMAQEALVVTCYNGKNNTGYQFEVTEEDRRILDTLVKTATFGNGDQIDVGTVNCINPLVPESVFYRLPKNLMFVTFEEVRFSDDDDACVNGAYAAVFPVTQDEFWKTYKNPFRGANNRRVLRLDAGDNIVELVSKNKIGKYIVRYVKRPSPIILVDLPDDLTIDDCQNEQTCLLDKQIHQKILEIAVNMALRTKSIGINK